jgi:hypothetical protein
MPADPISRRSLNSSRCTDCLVGSTCVEVQGNGLDSGQRMQDSIMADITDTIALLQRGDRSGARPRCVAE